MTEQNANEEIKTGSTATEKVTRKKTVTKKSPSSMKPGKKSPGKKTSSKKTVSSKKKGTKKKSTTKKKMDGAGYKGHRADSYKEAAHKFFDKMKPSRAVFITYCKKQGLAEATAISWHSAFSN